MGSIYVYVLVLTALAAVLSIPFFWLWAWAAGPAVKHLGRKWGEGLCQADDVHDAVMLREHRRSVADDLGGRVGREPVKPAPPVAARATDLLPQDQYSITGRRIR